MRNEVHDAHENVYDSVGARRNRRRKQTIAGLAGLAILGGGAYLVATQANDEPSTTRADDAAVSAPLTQAPDVPADSVAPSASASETPGSPAASRSTPAAAEPAPTRTKSREEQIEAAKGTAAKADNVKRPLPPVNANKAATDVTVTQTGSLKEGGTLKVVSAKQDLTGQRELSIVADKGRAVGEARCTQEIRFADSAESVEKPSMLICWRTSAGRSVYTVAVVPKGRPSADKSVAALEKQWSKLG